MKYNPFYAQIEHECNVNNQLQKKTKAALGHFKRYIETSIDALSKKEVTCSWKAVHQRLFRMELPKKLYRIIPHSTIECLSSQDGWFEILCEDDGTAIDSDFEADFDEKITVGKGRDRRSFPITSAEYRLANLPQVYLPDIKEEEAVISWLGYKLKIRSLSKPLDASVEVYVDGLSCNVIKVDKNRITVEGSIQESSQVLIDSASISFTLIHSFVGESSWTKENARPSWISTQKPQKNAHCRVQDITQEKYKTLQSRDFEGQSFDSKDWNIQFKGHEVLMYSVFGTNKKPPQKLRYELLGIEVKVEEKTDIEKWIQLIDDDESDDSKSKLDYFFEENIEIYDAPKDKTRNDKRYFIIQSNFEERQLLLKSSKTARHSVYPCQKTNQLRVRVDTSQLKKQVHAIHQLMYRPMLEQSPLLNLFVPKKEYKWPSFEPYAETLEWKVLTNLDYDGCKEQREFVCKALSCPDFAILDGPPGTGKTTTILELIAQLVCEGKRVLLTASTHAAINNVLERVQSNKTLQELIFPLRIGDKDKARGVEKYQYETMLERLQSDFGQEVISEKIMVDSSNLVCGTTIGILRLFKRNEVQLSKGIPPFDVMIIDECSKTLFQEFLVPGCYAKRWVLVGDVRQLSPFTDRDQIVANLNNIKDSSQGYVSSDLLEACYLLEKLRGNRKKPYSDSVPFIVPVSRGVLAAVAKECQARAEEYDKILVVKRNDEQKYRKNPEDFYRHSICFVDSSILPSLHSIFPPDAIVLKDGWLRTSMSFQHPQERNKNGFKKDRSFYLKSNSDWSAGALHRALLTELSKKNWAEEVCWRLERLYWLRLSKKSKEKTKNYRKALKRLYPCSVNVEKSINEVQNLAFPSILEALSMRGIQMEGQPETTIRAGFDEGVRNMRYTTLVYQHRMHQDMSKFPRNQFYQNKSLEDGSQHNREWSFSRYTSRNLWLNVNGTTQKGNSNQGEVVSLIKELKAFAGWAQKQKKQDWEVAVLTFYKGQEKSLRKALSKLSPENANRYSRFHFKGVSIKLATVDYFQGQEADVVYLSMVNTYRDGFLDSPNRLNVAITRARYQLVILGSHNYFSKKSNTTELKNLAWACAKKEKE